MSDQIIKQPNGKYCVFSSVVDDFIIVDATKEEIIKVRLADAEASIRDDVNKICEKLDNGQKPYYQFTMDFKQAVNTAFLYHGKESEGYKYFNIGEIHD